VADVAKGHVTLFTGLDLAGWKAGDQKANWKVGDNKLSYDGKADAGGKLQTEKEYGDVEVMLDVKAGKDARATLIVGKNEVPLTEAKETKAGAWNRYLVRSKGEGFTMTVNKGDAKGLGPHRAGKGPIALKVDGAAEFMNLFVRELK
jgi:hypothetical protein